jgi:NAD(P)-dependent dehydrogenase (short-subunit alcohol dehydrogenase family)
VAQQSVVITGSTQGLGFAYAREFVRRGHNVVICGRQARAVDEAVSRLTADLASGARAVGQVCDVSDAAHVDALWQRAEREFGAIDILISNAGYARSGATFLETHPAEIEAMVRTNVIGAMLATNVAYAAMKARGRGKLYITLGGGGGTGRVVRGMTVYSTTKRALKYFADCLLKDARGADGKGHGVLIGTISPGVNVTEGMLREIAELPPEKRASMIRPLNFIGEHVETTAPWIVERILNEDRQGNAIVWLTTGRLIGRAFSMLGGKRDILSRYGLTT